MEHPSLTLYARGARTFFSREKKVSKEKRGIARSRWSRLIVAAVAALYAGGAKNKKKNLAPRRTGRQRGGVLPCRQTKTSPPDSLRLEKLNVFCGAMSRESLIYPGILLLSGGQYQDSVSGAMPQSVHLTADVPDLLPLSIL